MKIALLTTQTFFENYAPSVHQARMLILEGCQVTIADACHPKIRHHEGFLPSTVKRIRPVRCYRAGIDERAPPRGLGLVRRSRYRQRLIEQIVRDPPNLHIAHEPHGCSAVPMRLLKRSDTLTVLQLHRHYSLSMPLHSSTRRRVVRAFEYTKQADLVLVAHEERGRLLQNEAHLTEAPRLVLNCPMRVDHIGEETLTTHLKKRGFENCRTVYFHGTGIGDTYCISSVVRSMRTWPDDVILILVGGPMMPAYKESLFRTAGEMGLNATRRIVPLGTFPPKKLCELAAGADVAVGLNDQSDINCRTNAGATNKRFEYMAAGAPQVYGHSIGLSKIIGGAGIQCVDDDPSSIGHAINDLLNDPVRRDKMSKTARRSHLEKYNYEAQFRPVLDEITERSL